MAGPLSLLNIFPFKFGVNQEQKNNRVKLTHPAITCLKLTIETLEQGVKYVQS